MTANKLLATATASRSAGSDDFKKFGYHHYSQRQAPVRLPELSLGLG